MNTYIGVDVAKTTGIAIICFDGGLVLTHCDRYEAVSLLVQLIEGCSNVVIGLEEQKSFGGIRTSYQAGLSQGIVEGGLLANKIPYRLIPIQKWQRKLLGKFPKGESKIKAKQFVNKLYPEVITKSQDEIDALCIAVYLREISAGNLSNIKG